MSSSSSSGIQVKTYDLFLGALAPDITEDFIVQHFKKFGTVQSVTLSPGKRNDGSQICFVRYVSRDEAVRAIQANVALEWNGTRIRVDAASRNGNCWYKELQDKSRIGKIPHEGHKGHKVERAHLSHLGLRPSNGAGDAEIQRKEEVMTTHHESPIVFWGQLCDRGRELKDLSEKLQQVSPGAQSLLSAPNMDKIYASIFSADGNWYRCKVINIASDNQVEVAFIDFGNRENKNVSEIRELLPTLANIKPLAQRYSLYGLKVTYDSDTAGYAQGTEKFAELTDGMQLTATIYNTNETGVIPVILEAITEAGVMDINQEMLSLGFAVCTKKNEMAGHQSHSKSPINLNVGQWMPDVTVPPPSSPNRIGMQNGNGIGGLQTQIKLRQKNTANSNNNYQTLSMVTVGGGDTQASGAEIMHLRQALDKSEREKHELAIRMKQMNEAQSQESTILKREWDHAALELEATRITLKKVREEYAEVAMKHNERSLPLRLARLVQSVERVKSYRIQFPSEEHKEDLIEQAFTVASDSSKVKSRNLPTNEKVAKAIVIYDATQNAIRAAGNTEELNDLIAARNGSRVNLHKVLTEFVNEAKELPLSKRSEEVETTLCVVLKTYPDFIRKDIHGSEHIGSFDEAFLQYKEWKNQKVTEFQEARTRTNTCHNGVNNSLRILQEQLSLDTGMCTNILSTLTGLDQLLDGFQEAVDDEARKTNIVSSVNESDTVIVAMLLKALEAELRRELSDIVHLRKQLTECSSYAEILSSWLEQNPQMEPITNVRKQIKTLKSKLRHKLADIQDMEEESEDSSNEEYLQLKEELVTIRLQLHKAFFQEDEVLANLAELNENQFPEISLQHPDLSVETVKQYNGLVKQGRALDQFHTEAMPFTKKKSVMKAVFCGKNCVLKEYIIDESMGVRKAEFLRRALFYNQIINAHILPIEALFFTGAGRQAYVQLPFYDKNLTTLLSEGPVSMEDAYHFLCKVLIGLQAIHSANLIFGALHPNNVLVSPDRSVVLSEMDFSKAPLQRAGAFTTSSRLLFQPPEFQKQEISWASDMYNFGLLALWLHFPSYKFTLRSNGVPDFSPLEMDRSLEQLLMSLLQEEPASRRMASSTWKLPYFSCSPHSRPCSPKTPHEEETLQLRRKSDPPTPKNGSGILKNKGTTSPTSSPIHSPQTPQKDLLQAITEVKLEDKTEAETPKVNGSCSEESATGEIMNQDSAQSTPDLISSPQGTPMNTPAEAESGNTSPPDGDNAENRMEKTTGLVKDAMLQASKLAEMRPDNEETGGKIHILEDLDSINDKMSILDEVARLEADIMAQTSGLLAASCMGPEEE